MGSWWSKLSGSLESFKKESHILMLGLDNAGKSTILYAMKRGFDDLKYIKPVPTIGFNCETIQYKNVSFTMWDVGGQDKLRPLWHHYFDGCNGIIFVVDSNDSSRFKQAHDELHKIVEDDRLAQVPILVFANKQDLPTSVRPTDLPQVLGLSRLHSQVWFVQGCTAKSGQGVYEGIDWLADAVNKT